MELANPILGLVALASIPAILALHMFRRRFRRRETAGLFLWVGLIREDWPGRRFQRMQRSVSLLCQIAAALLIALLLAGPRPTAMLESLHLVVVLDNSASMSARGRDGASFRDRAMEYLARASRELGEDAKMTVILTGERAETIAGPEDPAADALAKVRAGWNPMMPSHSPQTAIALAREFAPDDGAVLFITNRQPEQFSPGGTIFVHAVGEAMPNVGFVAARRERSPDSDADTVFAAVRNSFGASRRTRLDAFGYRDGNRVSLGSRNFQMGAGEAEYIIFEAPADIGLIELELPDDAFALDNRVSLLPHPARRVRVALDLPDGATRRRIMDAVRVMRDSVWTESHHDADLFIGSIGAARLSRARFRLGVAPSAASPESVDFFIGPYLMERRHRLFDGVTLEGIILAAPVRDENEPSPFPAGSTPLLSVGDRVLMVQAASSRAASSRTFLMDIDLARSNIYRSPDWPIFISNLVEMARDEAPGLLRSNYQIGETIRYNAGETAGGRELLVRSNEISETFPVIRESIDIPARFPPGVYEAVIEGDAAERFAVNFLDEAQSDLTALSSNTPPDPQQAAGMVEGEPSAPFEMILIALICSLLLADWAVRRAGVPRSAEHPQFQPEGA